MAPLYASALQGFAPQTALKRKYPSAAAERKAGYIHPSHSSLVIDQSTVMRTSVEVESGNALTRKQLIAPPISSSDLPDSELVHVKTPPCHALMYTEILLMS